MKSYLSLTTLVATSALGLAVLPPAAQAVQSDDESANSMTETMQENAEYVEAKARDAWLDGKLESALLFNEHLNSFDIDTSVKDGTVRLSGAVESDIDRDLAGEIAKSIKGVKDVENELVVDAAKARKSRDSGSSERDRSFKESVLNATLTARVKSQLLANGNTGGMSINVDSRDGVITLSGKVKSEEERELAARIAGNTAGAKSVRNQLSVSATKEEAE